jgi:TRAP-type uncharacterized transport system fused permease subunit
VSLAAFAGAGVAGAHPMRTAVLSWKLAKGLYVIPIVMAYRPLLGNGPPWEVVLAMVSCGAGLLSLAAALDRFLIRRATWLETVLLVAAAVCLLWPDLRLGATTLAAWASDVVGAVLLGVAILLQRRRREPASE